MRETHVKIINLAFKDDECVENALNSLFDSFFHFNCGSPYFHSLYNGEQIIMVAEESEPEKQETQL